MNGPEVFEFLTVEDRSECIETLDWELVPNEFGCPGSGKNQALSHLKPTVTENDQAGTVTSEGEVKVVVLEHRKDR
jgi:hypothetical protein